MQKFRDQLAHFLKREHFSRVDYIMCVGMMVDEKYMAHYEKALKPFMVDLAES